MQGFLKASLSILALQSLAFGAGGGLLVSKANTDWTPKGDGSAEVIKSVEAANDMYCGVSYGAGKINAISFDSKDNEGENYLMDVAMDGGLGHGGERPDGVNKQQFTFAIHNPKQVSDKNKVGYLEVIIDTSSAKSILVSQSKDNKEMKENIANNKVTSPEIYGQYKDSGIGFYIRGKDGRADLRLGTNFGRCKADLSQNKKLAELKKYVVDAQNYKDQNEAKKHEICQEDKVETIVDSTAKQFRVVIPDNLCENGKCLNNNFAYLVFKTDTFYRDCKKEAKTKDQFNASKSNFYGIRLSVKHSTDKYTGATNFVSGIGASAGAQSGSGTYNLPTLIIEREDELPSSYTKEMEKNKNNNKQLLWAACGSTDDVKNEIDCRKNGASCNKRIKVSEGEMITWADYNRRNNRDDKRLTTYMYPNNSPYPLNFNDSVTNTFGTYKCDQSKVQCGSVGNWASHFQCVNEITYDGNGVYRSTESNTYNRYAWSGPNGLGDYPQWCYAEPKKLFVFNGSRANNGATEFDFEGKCWKDFVWNSTIYSGGYLFVRKQVIQGNLNNDRFERNDTCWMSTTWSTDFVNDRTYQYHVKAPKIFTISLRDFEKKSNLRILDRNKVSSLVKSKSARELAEKVFEEENYKETDHQNLPGFEAKFRIVNASDNKNEAPKKYYFKKKMNCWIVKANGERTDKKLGNSITEGRSGNGRVNVEIEGTEDEPTFTIKSKDFSSNLKGQRIQCQLDFSDYTNVKDHGSKYRNEPFQYAGLYKNFAYNIQLASLKILNTKDAHYKDLALSTRCDFATYWDAFPGNVVEGSPIFYNQNDKFKGGKYIARKPFLGHESKRPEGNADESNSATGPNISSKTRHFRFDARPLFYAAKPVGDNEKLYAGYKYPEDLNQDAKLNPQEDLKFLHDKATNEKLIENKAIFFPTNYKSSLMPLELEARDANNAPILGYRANLTGVMASIYARDDELQKSPHAILKGVDTNWIQNCFDSNICRSVWANLEPNANKKTGALDGLAFVYSDIFDGQRYLAYNNKGETFLRLGDSDQTIFSQNNKTTHSNTPEALCDLDEPKSLCSDKDLDCKDFRKNGGLYSCDIIVVDSQKVGTTKDSLNALIKSDSFFERKGLKFYNFNPAMMKINTVLSNKSLTNSPYSSEKFTYHRAPCASYSNPDQCSDEVENATFTIQVGATGVNKADILANNFLSRYDGKAIAPSQPEKNIEFRGNLAAPVIVHVRGRTNNSSSSNDFRFKLASEQFKTMSLLLAPRCDMQLSYNGGLQEICQKGDVINENNYLAVATGATLEPASIKMHNSQTNYQNLLGNKSGTLDLKVFKGSYEKGVVELKNVRKTTNPNQELGLLFGQKSGDYSLKEKEPVMVKIKAQKAEVPENDENKWLKEQKLSAMVDIVGGAAILDVVLVAPNKQVGGSTGDLKDNAVFLAAYSSNPSVAKELQDAEILGDIIPGYANYYRIRRDAFGNELLDSLFEYSYDGGSLAGNNIIAVGKTTADVKQSGDFLRVPAGKQVYVKLKGDDAQMYCNFIRNCYSLPDNNGYGTIFTGYENKDAKWHGTGEKGKTIIDESIDKTRTRPTQRRLSL